MYFKTVLLPLCSVTLHLDSRCIACCEAVGVDTRMTQCDTQCLMAS